MSDASPKPQRAALGPRAYLAVTSAAWVMLACVASRPQGPRQAVSELRHAVDRGDRGAAEAQLSRAARREMGTQGVRDALRDSGPAISDRLRRFEASDRRLVLLARYPLVTGQTVTLRSTGGAWSIDGADLLPAHPLTVVEALAALRTALEQVRGLVLMNLLSVSAREGLDAEVTDLIAELSHPEQLDVEVVGDRARVQLPKGRVIELVQEAGSWRVDSIK